jgi:hypothetical protein
MNLTYEKCGDYLIPNIIPDPEPGEDRIELKCISIPLFLLYQT